MRVFRRPAVTVRIMALCLLASTLLPSLAAACIIDNTASLYANGVRAVPTTAPTSTTNPAQWAPFTVEKAFASGAPVQVSEARADLQRSLSAATLDAPFRWVLGDGAVVMGHSISHRFARPGTYHLMVYGYSKTTHSWYQFDSVLVHIVPPGQVLQSNLGYYGLRALDVVMSGLMWVIDGALVLLVAAIVLARVRSRRKGHAA